jgi:hypothetical protein
MQTKTRPLERTQFIKHAGDERVSCQANILVKSVKIERLSDELTNKQGPFAI